MKDVYKRQEVPYDPMISTNLSTAVKVEPWNVKHVHEEVEDVYKSQSHAWVLFLI